MSHKATPEQWAAQESWAQRSSDPLAPCLLELRSRIIELEREVTGQAQALASVTADCVSRIAALEVANSSAKLTRSNILECPDSSPAPTGGLVERVAQAIATDSGQPLHSLAVAEWSDEARAAILACADWLDRCKLLYRGGEFPGRWLREEVERD